MITESAMRNRVAAFQPDMTVVTTAPTYLFWRCPPPELRIPGRTVAALRPVGGAIIAVGPHASTAPPATLAKLGVDAALPGECEEVLVELASRPRDAWHRLQSVALVAAAGAAALAEHGRQAVLARHTVAHRVDELLGICAELDLNVERGAA